MQLSRTHSKVNSFIVERIPSLNKGYLQGILLTATLAIVSMQLSEFPFLSIMGAMVLSILMGVLWNNTMGVPTTASIGISFSSKWLLRVGITLMGLRLDIQQIYVAGAKVLALDAFVVLFTFGLFLLIGRWFNVPRHLTILTGIGTAVCGAAAIVAIAPIIHARKETTAAAISIIAIIGTVGTLIYTLLLPFLGISNEIYGILVGSTLHELAHVIAAGDAAGAVAGETAILTKLGRVALLIPMALLISFRMDSQSSRSKLQFPYFILGFLAMSLVNTFGWLTVEVTNSLVVLSVFLLTMAMAGIGLSVNVKNLTSQSGKGFVLCAMGSVVLAVTAGTVISFLY